MIAIGGGGYVPARILRSFLKTPGSPNIPIQAIGLSLYETLSDAVVEEPGKKVTRTQWLDLTSLGEMKNLIGKKILIVDEVDDTRTTLEYAVKELQKDVEAARQKMGAEGEAAKTEFSIFVLHVCTTEFPMLRDGIEAESQALTYCETEQEQAQEGYPSRRNDGTWSLHGRPHGRRRVDLLPLGGERHRGARRAGEADEGEAGKRKGMRTSKYMTVSRTAPCQPNNPQLPIGAHAGY
jgi:hypoxanthine phosphoribosyltransferase